MSTDTRNRFTDGEVLLFNKPLYWTSFDLVNKVRIMIRSELGISKLKVGHAGTLDPLATGLMILCTGRATKRIEEFKDLDKEYIGSFHLGATTPSYDLETEINGTFETNHITEELVRKALSGFLGEQQQVPPMHSAKLIDGKRAYEFARQGVERDLKPVKVVFRETELLEYSLPEMKIRLVVSKGTYIRSFARDLGERLKSGCYMSGLERSAVGSFTLDGAWSLEKFDHYLKGMKQI